MSVDDDSLLVVVGVLTVLSLMCNVVTLFIVYMKI